MLKNLLRSILLTLLQGYRYLISPWLGPHCRFYPSCSAYCQAALTEKSLGVGLWLTVKRLLRCHPLHPGGFDPLP
ncbi:MAG: membrane protein insertion efficiency factor YidD [Gammaproteobacteria bacterium]